MRRSLGVVASIVGATGVSTALSVSAHADVADSGAITALLDTIEDIFNPAYA
jgi:hypothetical protein